MYILQIAMFFSVFRDDDFVQETDYGYTYIQGQNQPALPTEWGDTVGTNWQRNTKNKQNNRYIMQQQLW